MSVDAERTGTDAIRCVVVEDHVMVLQMLCGVVRTLGGIDIVATGTSFRDADRLAATRAIDLVILDAALTDGDAFGVLRALIASHPGLTCVLITSAESSRGCPSDLIDRIAAVVDKADPWEALQAAIERAVGDRLQAGLRVPTQDQLRARLTCREYDVFERLGRGLSNKEIATALAISVQTVETHRKAISKKFGCNGASLVRLATLSQHLSLP